MRVLVTNTACLNSGDAAILAALYEDLMSAFGDQTEILVADNYPSIGPIYYPGYNYCKLAWDEAIPKLIGMRSFGRALHKKQCDKMLAYADDLAADRGPASNRGLTKRARAAVERFYNADLVVSTGGTYLVDHYGIDARLFEFELATRVGTPLVLYTQSVGPLWKQPKGGRLAKLVGKAAAVFLRDERSLEELSKIDTPTDRCEICYDSVFAWGESKAPSARLEANDRPLVGISVREWPRLDADTADAYESAVASAAEHAISRYDADVVFVSTCQGIPEYRYNDSRIADKISERLPGALSSRCRVVKRFVSPAELLKEYGRCDIVVATRMHASILALCAGTPVVNIAYEFKSTELFEALGWADRVHDISTLTAGQLTGSMDRLMEGLPEHRAEVLARVQEAAESAGLPRRRFASMFSS